MKGIERITDRIGADAQAEIDGVMGKAQAKADEIRQGYEAQAAKARTEAENRSRKAAEDREARLVDAAEMDRRKLLLSAKQEMVGKAFDLALEKLCAMEDAGGRLAHHAGALGGADAAETHCQGRAQERKTGTTE